MSVIGPLWPTKTYESIINDQFKTHAEGAKHYV